MAKTAASPQFPCQTCEVRDCAICAVLEDDELLELNAIATAVELEAGATVFHEGDENTYLFNVVKGAVRLSKLLADGRRQITGFLFPGDFLGLSIANVYAYSAEAITDVSLCRFSRRGLTEFMGQSPKLEHQLLALASNELVEAQEQMLVLGRKTATERVVTFLIKLAERIGRQAGDGWELDLPMTRTDLGDYLGLTTETVSRTMSRLRDKGVICTSGVRSVHVRDANELTTLSGDV